MTRTTIWPGKGPCWWFSIAMVITPGVHEAILTAACGSKWQPGKPGERRRLIRGIISIWLHPASGG